MVARRFYVACRLEIGLNFNMLIHLLLGVSWTPFSLFYLKFLKNTNFQGAGNSIPQMAMLYLL